MIWVSKVCALTLLCSGHGDKKNILALKNSGYMTIQNRPGSALIPIHWIRSDWDIPNNNRIEGQSVKCNRNLKIAL